MWRLRLEAVCADMDELQALGDAASPVSCIVEGWPADLAPSPSQESEAEKVSAMIVVFDDRLSEQVAQPHETQRLRSSDWLHFEAVRSLTEALC